MNSIILALEKCPQKKKGETEREEKKRKIGGKQGCMRYNYMQH
jgi:hypothetical protein